jgi:N-acetylmuramate 1-kinase
LIGEAARSFLRRSLRGPCRIAPIAGDASTKAFFRVRTRARSVILMVNPDPIDPGSPLISNHRILESIGAPVPRILGRDDAAGLVLTEDFGDTTLQRYLVGKTRRGPSTLIRTDLYRQACDLIALLQVKGTREMKPGEFAARNALDRERFLFELGHFRRHFIGGYLGLELPTADEALLGAFFDTLAEECDRMPRVYCHRDFMSRNLMVKGGRLRLIDYQDARLGPYTYDAASLLRDSSLDLEEDLVGKMVGYLAEALGTGPEEFRRDFSTMALERNIKELGTFGFMASERGWSRYLEYVPRAVRSIRRTMAGERRFHFIHPLFDRYVFAPSAARLEKSPRSRP